MPAKGTTKKPAASVEGFLASLEHPFKKEIVALRELILGIDSRISDEIKWNTPSFRTSDHFATMQLRAKGCVQIILHFGAKRRDVTGLSISDPEKVLEWLGPDRASVKFTSLDDIAVKRPVFEGIVRQWLQHL